MQVSNEQTENGELCKQIGSSSMSCIDYKNTHFNSDWTMRHGNIIKEQIRPSSVAATTSIAPSI